MRRSLSASVLIASLATPFVARSAEEPPVFRQEQVWFHAATTPAGNLDYIVDEIEPSLADPVTWDTTPPSAGPGGVMAANNYSVFLDFVEPGWRERNTFTARGTFTGDIDTLAVDVYYAGPFASLCGMSLAFDLRIDGAEILRMEQSAPSAGLYQEAAGRFWRVRFMFTRIFEMAQMWGVERGPQVEHEVYLNLANFYACQEAVWVYDRPEAPAAMTFNLDPASPAAARYTKIDVFDPPPPL